MSDLAKIESEAGEITSKESVVAGTALDRARLFLVVNQDTLNECGELIKDYKDRAKLLEEKRKYQKEPPLESCRRIDAMFKPVIEMYEKARRELKGSASDYLEEQENIRREEERIEQEKADKERRRKEDLARKARERGDHKKAQEHQQVATNSIPRTVEPTVEKPKGMVFREIWSAEVTDIEKLIVAVADQINLKKSGADMTGRALIPVDVLVADTKRLNKLASSLKDMFNLPGVRASSRRV